MENILSVVPCSPTVSSYFYKNQSQKLKEHSSQIFYDLKRSCRDRRSANLASTPLMKAENIRHLLSVDVVANRTYNKVQTNPHETGKNFRGYDGANR